MNQIIQKLKARNWGARFAALIDGSAWLLILPFALLWYLIDPIDLKVMVAWLLRLPIVVGVTIIISRIFFPSLKLGSFLEQSRNGNIAAGLVVAGLMVFLGMLIMTAAGWAK